MSQGSVDLDSRIGYAVKRLQQAVRVAAERELRPLGLTMPQYAALSALIDRPGLSNSELARRCFVTRQSMNEVLAGLHRAGLVIRVAHPQDGRVQQTQLTDVARAVCRRADDAVARVEQRLTMQLNKTERDQLLSLLGTCTANLEAAEPAETG